MLSVVELNGIMLCTAIKSIVLGDIMLSVIVLGVIILCVVMLSSIKLIDAHAICSNLA